MFDLTQDNVTGHFWSGLFSLRRASSVGEPLAKHPGVSNKIAQWLLERDVIPAALGFDCFGPVAAGD